MKKEKFWLKRGELLRGGCMVICTIVVTCILTRMSWFSRLDAALGDALYQVTAQKNENIHVIGIDAYALEEIGAWPWDRSVIAEVVEALNADPLTRPAAIGIDVVYAGPTDPEEDAALVRAAQAGNVVVAGMMEYGTRMQTKDNGVFLDSFTVVETILPFEQLGQVAQTGHINAMYDFDGVLRHHLWEVQLPDGSTIPSMAQRLYEMYCDAHGLAADFTPEINTRGFWLIDYSAEPGEYYDYSVQDILTGNYDPELLADSIVLIGPYDTGLSDDFVTAADHAKRMYGVEYVANVTSALLDERNPIEVPDMWQYGIFAGLWCLSGAFFYFSRLRFVIPVYLLLAFGSVGMVQLMYKGERVMHPLWMPVGLTLLFFVSVAERYVVAAKERRFIANTFAHYVDPSVLNELLKEDKEALGLGGKTQNIAVLFVDIRGFTPLSEKLAPEKVVNILNAYLTLTSDCIKSNGGTLDKFIGDCTMAIWGAPLPCDDPVMRACKAAMDMVQRGKKMEEELFRQFGHRVGFGVGIHFGAAVVGNIGALNRMDYTAIGDTVNTASRLEANAPSGKIYISREVAEILGERAIVTSLGTSIALKGKSAGFEVLELQALLPGKGEVVNTPS